MRTPEGVIEIRLEPVIASLTDAVDRFSGQSDRQAAMIREALEAAKGVAEGSSTSLAALRENVGESSDASRAALGAARDSSDAMAKILDQFNADAWEQVELLRKLLERTDGAFQAFAEAVVKSSADMAAHTQGFRDGSRALQTSAEMLAMATERLVDIAENPGTRRIVPKKEVIG